jgi:hypothetical protein
MRKRYQQGSVTKSSDGRYWIGKYRENERHKTKLLGKHREITKSAAQEKFAEFYKDDVLLFGCRIEEVAGVRVLVISAALEGDSPVFPAWTRRFGARRRERLRINN